MCHLVNNPMAWLFNSNEIVARNLQHQQNSDGFWVKTPPVIPKQTFRPKNLATSIVPHASTSHWNEDAHQSDIYIYIYTYISSSVLYACVLRDCLLIWALADPLYQHRRLTGEEKKNVFTSDVNQNLCSCTPTYRLFLSPSRGWNLEHGNSCFFFSFQVDVPPGA